MSESNIHNTGEIDLASVPGNLDGGTYYLSNDISTGTKHVYGTVTVCLCGHKWNLGSGCIALNPGATLTINDCSQDNSGYMISNHSESIIKTVSTASVISTLIINGGTLEHTVASDRGAIQFSQDRPIEFQMNGGTIVSKKYGIRITNCSSGSHIVINDGSIRAGTSAVFLQESDISFALRGGNIDGNTSGIYAALAKDISIQGGSIHAGSQTSKSVYGIQLALSYMGTLHVTNGKIVSEGISNSYGVYSENGNITISNESSSDGPSITGGTHGMLFKNGNCRISGGTIKAINAGDSYGVFADSGILTITDGNYIGNKYGLHVGVNVTKVALSGGVFNGGTYPINSAGLTLLQMLENPTDTLEYNYYSGNSQDTKIEYAESDKKITSCKTVYIRGFTPTAGVHNCSGLTYDNELTNEVLKKGLSTGNYYLSSGISAGENIPVRGSVRICLNGKSIDLSDYHFELLEGSSLEINDCKGEGKITASDSVIISSGAYHFAVNIKGGTIMSDRAVIHIPDGGALSGSSIHITNGTIVSSYASGIIVSDENV